MTVASRHRFPAMLGAVGLTAATVLAACSSGGSDTSTTTATTAPVTAPAPSTAPTTAKIPTPDTIPMSSGVDPKAVDVPDDVFSGLGDPRIDVLHYDVTLSAAPNVDKIEGSVDITLRPRTTGPLASFTLDLRGPSIVEATVDGTAAEVVVAPEPDAGQVDIVPAKALAPDTTATVHLRYAGVPATSDFPLGSGGVGWQSDDAGGWFTMSEPDGTSSWVPVNDHPSDKATWTITLDTPEGVQGVANGSLVSSETKGGRTAWRWELDRPMPSYTVLAAVGAYRITEWDGPDGVAITLAVAESYDTSVDDAFKEIDDILTYFSDTFGPYPYADSGALVVDTPLGVALETTTRPLFGADGVSSDRVWALAHELAHQWWGDSVSLTTWDDLWLNEGFATYSDWLYEDHTGFMPIEDNIDASGPTADRAVTDPVAARSFSRAVYSGGAIALHALRHQLGDDTFFNVLSSWFTDHRDESVTTEAFVAHAQDMSGTDLAEWQATWLDKAPQPAMP